jgi:hypothetical protein
MGMNDPEWVKKLEAEPCTCEPCSSCNGRGTVYWLLGKYCGPNHPCDDLADTEPCEECHGGVVELCDRCAALEDYDTWSRN